MTDAQRSQLLAVAMTASPDTLAFTLRRIANSVTTGIYSSVDATIVAVICVVAPERGLSAKSVDQLQAELSQLFADAAAEESDTPSPLPLARYLRRLAGEVECAGLLQESSWVTA